MIIIVFRATLRFSNLFSSDVRKTSLSFNHEETTPQEVRERDRRSKENYELSEINDKGNG